MEGWRYGIFQDKASGARDNRAGLQKALDYLQPGDCLQRRAKGLSRVPRRRGGIATMQKPAERILGGNAGQCLDDCFL